MSDALRPEFVAAVLPVVRWCRANGWVKHGPWGGYRNGVHQVAVWQGHVTVYAGDGMWQYADVNGWVASPQQVVDVLCALGVLPWQFSTPMRRLTGRLDELVDA